MRMIRNTIDSSPYPMKPLPQLPPRKPEPQPRPAGNPSTLESSTLFGTRQEILIAHGNETYRLRRTRQGKLILTK